MRALTIGVIVAALVLLTLRLGASAPSSGFEAGRAVGRLMGGPLLLGAILWVVIWYVQRRRGSRQKFLSLGLLGSIAVFVVAAALTR